MAQRKLIITNKACDSFRTLIENVSSTSLVGAEDARTVIINRLRKLAINPNQQSRKAKFSSLSGDFRSVLAWNYRIYYKVEDDRVIVLDLFLDKG